MLGLRVVGLKEFEVYFAAYVGKMRGVVVQGVADYLLGNGQRGLKHYVGYKYVSRRAAGVPWKSDRQRRFVMAAIRSGRIDPGAPHRTGKMQRGWHREGQGVSSKIVQDMDYAYYVMDTKGQARQPAKVGWHKVADIIESNIAGAVRFAEQQLAKLRK